MNKFSPPSAFFSRRTLAAIYLGSALVAAVALLRGTSAQAQEPKQDLVAGKISPEDARILAAGIKPLVNDSTEGLISVRQANGSVMTDLGGRFQNVTVAKKEADGRVTQGCVNNPEAAAGFFGLDRQLLVEPAKTQPEKPTDR